MAIKKRVLIYLFSLLLIPTFTHALSFTAPLYGLDIVGVYQNYNLVIDSLILTMLFVGTAQFSLGRHFGKEKGGKAVIVGVGLSLALAAIFFEYRTGWRIINLGPWAVVILSIIFGFFIYQMTRLLCEHAAIPAGFVVFFIFLNALIPGQLQWLQTYRSLWTAVNLLTAFSGIMLVIGVVRCVWTVPGAGGGGGGVGPGAQGHPGGPGQQGPTGPGPTQPPNQPIQPPPGTFTITGVEPRSAPQDAGVITLHVTGSGFDHLRTLSFPFHANPGGAHPLHLVSDIRNHTPTSFDIDINVSLDHDGNPTNLGHYDAVAQNTAGATARLDNCFEIVAPGSITITNVTPASARQDQGVVTLHVEGNNLNLTTGLNFPFHTNPRAHPLHRVGHVRNLSAASFDIDVNVSVDHAGNPSQLGMYDIVVDGRGGLRARKDNVFEILPPRNFSITSVSPDRARQDQGIITLHVEGTGLDDLDIYIFPSHTNPTGVSPLNVVPRSFTNHTPRGFDVNVDVSVDEHGHPTTLGKYDIIARSRAGAATRLDECFEILSPGGPPPPPPPSAFTIRTVTPGSAHRDEGIITLTVRGTGFDTMTDVNFPFNADPRRNPLNRVSGVSNLTPASFEIKVNVSKDRNGRFPELGEYDTTTQNNAGLTARLERCFRILPHRIAPTPVTPPPPPPPPPVTPVSVIIIIQQITNIITTIERATNAAPEITINQFINSNKNVIDRIIEFLEKCGIDSMFKEKFNLIVNLIKNHPEKKLKDILNILIDIKNLLLDLRKVKETEIKIAEDLDLLLKAIGDAAGEINESKGYLLRVPKKIQGTETAEELDNLKDELNIKVEHYRKLQDNASLIMKGGLDYGEKMDLAKQTLDACRHIEDMINLYQKKEEKINKFMESHKFIKEKEHHYEDIKIAINKIILQLKTVEEITKKDAKELLKELDELKKKRKAK